MNARDIVSRLLVARLVIDREITTLTYEALAQGDAKVPVRVGCKYMMSNGRTAITTHVDADDGEIAAYDDTGEIHWWKPDGSPGLFTEDVPVKLLAELKPVEESK